MKENSRLARFDSDTRMIDTLWLNAWKLSMAVKFYNLLFIILKSANMRENITLIKMDTRYESLYRAIAWKFFHSKLL